MSYQNKVTPLLNLFIGALRLANPINMIRNLLRYRSLTIQMVQRDIGQRYKGSYLGLFWSVINPLFMLAIYTFVFSVVFKGRWGTATENAPIGEYALLIFAGLIPFNLFSEMANRASSLVLSYPNFVKKVVFPLEILPVITAGSATITSIISIGLLLVASQLFLGKISSTAIFVPLIYLPLLFLSLGLGWFLSAIGVYFRDFAQIIPLVTQILFFLTPIVYPAENIPTSLQWVMKINPLAMIVTNFRNLLIWNVFFPIKEWTIWTILTSIIAMLGYGWFVWSKKGFADVM
jgi:lipopolysaccharide transport system permease protein